jgi:hypothetical protein
MRLAYARICSGDEVPDSHCARTSSSGPAQDSSVGAPHRIDSAGRSADGIPSPHRPPLTTSQPEAGVGTLSAWSATTCSTRSAHLATRGRRRDAQRLVGDDVLYAERTPRNPRPTRDAHRTTFTSRHRLVRCEVPSAKHRSATSSGSRWGTGTWSADDGEKKATRRKDVYLMVAGVASSSRFGARSTREPSST